MEQDIKTANVITQYPVEKVSEIYNATVEWINPNMTEASNATSEASKLNDLSHQGTVPSPKTNSPTSNSSTISESRHLSMREDSENNSESQAHFSLEESKPREKYDGRYGRAQRKYTKLLGQKRNELGRHVEYDELPDLTTDDEFKSVVGMTKKEYADLMQERDKVANEMRHEYQKTGQKFKQAQVDRYNPIKIIERIINGGDLRGAEKSAYKSLFTAGNMDEVMYNAIYVGLQASYCLTQVRDKLHLPMLNF